MTEPEKGKGKHKKEENEDLKKEAEEIIELEKEPKLEEDEEEIPKEPTIEKGRETTMRIGKGKRDDFANLLDKFEESAKGSIDSYQGMGAREIFITSIYLDARSGLACTTDENGIPHIVVTGEGPGAKGKKIRQKFFAGFQIEATTKDRIAETSSIKIGRAPREFDITHQAGEGLKKAIPAAQNQGDEIQTKIDEENYEYFPVHITPAEKNTVAEDMEPDPNLEMVKDLVSYAYGEIADRLGDKADKIKVELIKIVEHVLYADSLGSQTDIVYPRVSFTIDITTKKKSHAFATIRGAGGTIKECLTRYIKEDAPESEYELKKVISDLVGEVVKDAGDLDRAQPVSNAMGNGAPVCPVILSPQVAGVVAHEIWGHTAEADIICENRRTEDVGVNLKARIGSQVSDYPHFSMIDTPEKELIVDGKKITRFNWGALPVGGYGNRGKIVKIIEDGTMIGILLDRYTLNEIVHGLRDPEQIKKTGVTGNARREKFDCAEQIRMRTTAILPDPDGPNSKEEMARLIPANKKGLYIKTCNGGAVNTDSGDFQINANLCYLIENKTITEKPIKDVVIVGNIKHTSLIKSIGNVETIDDTFAGWCGKNNQSVPVDGTSPILYIESAKLAGGNYRPWIDVIKDYLQQHREAMMGKRGEESINLPEFSQMTRIQKPQHKICMATLMLPQGEELRYLMGLDDFSTHEMKDGKLVEKRDKYE